MNIIHYMSTISTIPDYPLFIVCDCCCPQQLCNTCSAQSAVATAELCLCRAGGEVVSPRSVQQISECSDGTGLDIGTQVESLHC